MTFIFNNWLKILLLLSVGALGSAAIAEYFFYLAPCNMCIKQRYAYYIIIFLIIIFYFLKREKSIWFLILNEFSILYGLFYAIWHVGVEKKILKGPKSCSGITIDTNSIQNLKEQIINQPIINCSEISWIILGLSGATINSILLLFILIFNSIFIFRNYYDKN